MSNRARKERKRRGEPIVRVRKTATPLEDRPSFRLRSAYQRDRIRTERKTAAADRKGRR